MTDDEIDRRAKKIARNLFVGGMRMGRARRLVMEFRKPLDGPGWSENAAADEIARTMRAARKAKR